MPPVAGLTTYELRGLAARTLRTNRIPHQLEDHFRSRPDLHSHVDRFALAAFAAGLVTGPDAFDLASLPFEHTPAWYREATKRLDTFSRMALAGYLALTKAPDRTVTVTSLMGSPPRPYAKRGTANPNPNSPNWSSNAQGGIKVPRKPRYVGVTMQPRSIAQRLAMQALYQRNPLLDFSRQTTQLLAFGFSMNQSMATYLAKAYLSGYDPVLLTGPNAHSPDSIDLTDIATSKQLADSLFAMAQTNFRRNCAAGYPMRLDPTKPQVIRDTTGKTGANVRWIAEIVDLLPTYVYAWMRGGPNATPSKTGNLTEALAAVWASTLPDHHATGWHLADVDLQLPPGMDWAEAAPTAIKLGMVRFVDTYGSAHDLDLARVAARESRQRWARILAQSRAVGNTPRPLPPAETTLADPGSDWDQLVSEI